MRQAVQFINELVNLIVGVFDLALDASNHLCHHALSLLQRPDGRYPQRYLYTAVRSSEMDDTYSAQPDVARVIQPVSETKGLRSLTPTASL